MSLFFKNLLYFIAAIISFIALFYISAFTLFLSILPLAFLILLFTSHKSKVKREQK